MASSLFKFYFQSYGKTFLVALLGVIILLAYFHHSGIGISPDSVNYLSTAETWLRSGRFDNFHHLPLIDFPVGYPLWLAFWMKIMAIMGLMSISLTSMMHMAMIGNMVLFMVLIHATDALLQQFSTFKQKHRLLLLTIYVTSPCLLEVYSYAWSETLFLPLCMISLLALVKYVRSGAWMDLCIAALCCAWAWTTRYAGVALVITGIFLMLFPANGKKNSLLVRLWHACVFGCISSSLILLNLFRNHLVGNYATGMREKSLTPLGENLRQAGDVIAYWWPIFSHQMNGVLMLMVLILSLLCCMYFLQQHAVSELAMMSLATVYLIFIITIASITRFQTLDSRLLSPAYIPLLAGLAGGLSHSFRSFVRLRKHASRIILFAGYLLWIIFQINNWMQNADNYDGIKDAGIPGYTEDGWQQSPSIQYLIQHAAVLAQIPIWYSDADDAIYFFTRKQAYALPHKENDCEKRLFQDAPQAMIFWFDDAADNDLISRHDIEQYPDVHVWKRFDDGVIYWKGKNIPQVLKDLR